MMIEDMQRGQLLLLNTYGLISTYFMTSDSTCSLMKRHVSDVHSCPSSESAPVGTFSAKTLCLFTALRVFVDPAALGGCTVPRVSGVR